MAFRYEGRSVCIVAPTGKAAANVSGQTIHRALGWGVGGIMGPTETIEDDVLIVDESSMISNDLMLMLIVNTSKKTQIVFVGDPDQLPPIGKGEPFKNFIKSQVVPTFRLTKIHRQEGESAIPYLAKEIREGRIISVDDPSVEIVEDPSTGGKKRRGDDESPLERLTDRLIEKYLQLIISSKKTSNPISVEDVLILVPYSSSKMKPNATTINETLQHVRFKKFPNLYCYETKKKKFAKGDRVIRTKNKMIELSDGTIILNANGDMGTVVEGDAGGLYIEFDRDDIDEIIKIPRDEIRNIQLAYALTVHKAQGSEADYVVVAAHPSNRFLFDRSAFYTAVTRARKKVVIITPSREEAHKLYEKEKSARKSLLSFRMKTFLKERKKLWDAGQVERQRYVNFEKTLKKIKENSNDHYSLLGVSRSSTGEEIKAAFRKIAGDIHPDHNEIDTTKEFQAVNEAYQVLSDPGRRIKYDNKRRIQ